jgi:hypothetical protein
MTVTCGFAICFSFVAKWLTLLLNLAIGSNGGEPDDSQFPLRYYIDYVRGYQ